jgi:iron(III) transport system substrate-binding protein
MRTRLGAAVLLALLLTGCGGAEQPTTRAADDPVQVEQLARQEGQLTWLAAGTQAAADKTGAAFQAKYGITVTVQRYSSADMGNRVQGDVRSLGRIDADVTTQTDNALALSLREQNLIPAASESTYPGVPASQMYGEVGPLVQYAVPVIGYNKALLAGFEPKTWADLLDPRLRGQIMIVDPRTAVTWGQIYRALLTTPGLGEGYLRQLAAQDYQPVASSLVGAEQLTAGQGAVLVASTPSVFDAQIAKGAPLAYFSPADPAPVAYTSVSVVEQAAHPNAAKLFATWLAGPEGSQVFNAAEGTASPLGTLPGAFPLPAGVSTTPPDPQAVRDAGVQAAQLLGFQ